MAARFWVGGTGTWDTSQGHWATVTNGSPSGVAAPVAGDQVSFDANSGASAVVTVASNAVTNLAQLSMTGFTGTLDFSVNNNNVSLNSPSGSTGFADTSGTNTLNMGNGTWTITASGAVAGSVLWNCANATMTLNKNGSTLVFTGTNMNYAIRWGGKALGPTQFTSTGKWDISNSAGTFDTLSIGPGNNLQLGTGITYTIVAAPAWTGTVGSPIILSAANVGTSPAVITAPAGMTLNWGSLDFVTSTNAATATNTAAYRTNTGWTITPASAGGGGGGVIGG